MNPQALRIAIIHHGRIIEDRTLPTGQRQSVSVGADPKATFCVPMSDTTTRTTLFEVTKAGALVVAEPALEGRVQVDGLERPLSEHPRGAVLPKAAKGRIRVGDVTVLFQIVTPPPMPAPPELPKGATGFIAQLDRSFVVALTLSFAAHLAGAGYVMAQPAPVEPELSLEAQLDRHAAVLLPLPKQAVPTKDPVAPKQTSPSPSKKVAPAESVVAKAPSKPVSADELKSKLSRAGMLAVIGSKGDGEGLVGDLLKDASVVGSVSDAMKGTDGFRVASAADALKTGLKGDDSGTAVTVGAIGTNGTQQVSLTERGAIAVQGRVREEAVSVETSDVPADELSKWMRLRRGAIQSCYERELKRNHQLSGRLVVKFSITPRGRVAGLDLSEGTLQDPGVAGCIASLAKSWVLPFTPEDEVAVAFPFVFAPAS
jgi:outer membrane biosynthesis protein TonB